MPETIGEGLRALVIEDEDVIRSVVLEVLEGMGFAAGPAVSLADARRKLAEATTDLLVVDKNLPDGSGLLLVKELADKDVDAQVVLMSGYANLSSAVDALQAGVADYIIKPFDLADFRARLQRATEALRLRRANRRLLRSEEHTSELQSHGTISYAVFCLKKKKKTTITHKNTINNYKIQST